MDSSDSSSDDEEDDDDSAMERSSEAGSTLQKKFYLNIPFHHKGSNLTPSIFSGKSNQSSNSHRDRESAVHRDLFAPSDRRSGASTPMSTSSNGNTGHHGNSTLHSSNGRSGSHLDDPDADDVSLMMNRASNYMAIVDIRIASTTLCVSHKGQGARNILDIHEFVLNLPEINYQNKTWSNMDLVLHLKKDITKILLSHTGALIGNKIRKRHRRKKGQAKQLHQISNYVSFMSVDELAKEKDEKDRKVEPNSPSIIQRIETRVSSLSTPARSRRGSTNTDGVTLSSVPSLHASKSTTMTAETSGSSQTNVHTEMGKMRKMVGVDGNGIF